MKPYTLEHYHVSPRERYRTVGKQTYISSSTPAVALHTACTDNGCTKVSSGGSCTSVVGEVNDRLLIGATNRPNASACHTHGVICLVRI